MTHHCLEAVDASEQATSHCALEGTDHDAQRPGHPVFLICHGVEHNLCCCMVAGLTPEAPVKPSNVIATEPAVFLFFLLSAANRSNVASSGFLFLFSAGDR